ncbi:TolC family protein [Phormidium tenue FACHB-886]|nr:TolC family protein [Phormidium tenue FACHB-886]
MQSSRSLIALGIGTAVAIGSVGAAPGQAAPLLSRHADSAVASVSEKAASEETVEEAAKLDQSPKQSLDQPSTQRTKSAALSSLTAPTAAQPTIEFSSLKAKTTEAQSTAARSQPAQNQPVERRVDREEISQDTPTPTPEAPTPATPPETAVPTPAPSETAPETPAGTTPAPESSPAPEAAPTPEATPPAISPTTAPTTIPPTGGSPNPNAPNSLTNPPSQEFSPGALDTTTPPVILPRTETSTEPAPDYLNPDPNPLSFPTRPEEVEIVGIQPITLQQAIELAIRNNRQLQEARLNVENAQAQLRQAEAQNSPTVNLQSGLVFQAQEQANQTRDPQTGLSTGFDGTSFPNTTSLSASVEASYNIFTSGVRSATIRAQREQVRFQELQLESATEELILQVTNNYYDLQNADEQVRIAQDALTEAQQSLRDAQALERAGVGTRFDVLQSQVDVANAQQTLTQQISDQEVARRQLAQQIALAQAITITAADPIEPAGLWNLTLEESIVLAFRNRAELEQFLVQREIGVQNRRRALGQIRPQVTAQTSYGVTRTLDSSSGPTFDGFLSNFQAQIGVSWNIFDGGAARAEADQAEVNIAIAETNFADQREQIRFAVEQAYSVLQSSYSNIQVTTLAVQQATEALRLARLRFQAGVGTQTDVLQQQTALTQAEVNRLTAILNYNRALATLDRQVSNYPEGNLADTP